MVVYTEDVLLAYVYGLNLGVASREFVSRIFSRYEKFLTSTKKPIDCSC